VNGKEKRLSLSSLAASVYECDQIYQDEIVKQYDLATSYTQTYRLQPVEGYEGLMIKTIGIPNGGKRKWRFVHIAEGYIQDRCMLIHRMISTFLRYLGYKNTNTGFVESCDAMQDHQIGVRFLMKITTPEYRYAHCNTIFGSDFSSATDTLSQSFQKLVTDALLPDFVSEFWKYISGLVKTFIMPDGTMILYTQLTGQPQGLLGTFDLVSLSHHVLMRMLMKKCGLEHLSARDFYVIVGDDSIISFDESLYPDVYEVHSWLCQNANLKKNHSKSTISHFRRDIDDPEDEGQYDKVLLDFAKVSVYDGKFASPIPPGLALKYANSIEDRLAVPLWLASRGVTAKKWFYRLILLGYHKKPYYLSVILAVVSSGQIPYLQGFYDPDIVAAYPMEFTGACVFAYTANEIKHTLIGYFISDSKKKDELKGNLSFDRIFADFFLLPLKEDDEDAWKQEAFKEYLNSAPNNCKCWDILTNNSDIAQEMLDLFEIDDPAYMACLSNMLSTSRICDEVNDFFDKYLTVVEAIKEDDLDSVFETITGFDPGFEFSDTTLQDIRSCQVRSFRERGEHRSYFFRGTVQEFQKLFGASEYSLMALTAFDKAMESLELVFGNKDWSNP
jgi:hypothetical protein